jgi:peptidoglycan/LPS O-acetylase OafA/YrhL
MKERRYDIDWLRVTAMLAVFIFHCTRFFDTEGWHLKNSEQSYTLFVLVRGLFWPWLMELLFLLSGAGSWYALKSKTATEYLYERFKRLLIPLYTVGLFILLPLQFYFELVTDAGYSGTFWQIIPRYFARLHPPQITSWPEMLLPIPFSGHLWFLQFLFLISLVTLPLLLCLKSEWGQRWIGKLAGWCDHRGGIFLFVIPLALILISLRGLFRGQNSWADFLWYAIYFIIGYVMVADKRFTKAFNRHQWVCLVLWIIGFFGGGGLFVLALGYDPMPGNESLSFIYVLYQIVWSIASWSAVVFMLSLGAKYLNFTHKMLAHSNEAVLPFYLFHQTIILIVGFFVIRWNIGILPKFLIVTMISFVLILVSYELFVKPFDIMRFFFGMRPRKLSDKKKEPSTA